MEHRAEIGSPRQVLRKYECIVILVASLLLGGCRREETQSSAKGQSDRCPSYMYCSVPLPPPTTYQISDKHVPTGRMLRSYLRQDLPDADRITLVGPSTNIDTTDRYGRPYKRFRIYFATARKRPTHGSIWVVFGHVAGDTPRRQVLVRDIDRTKTDVRIDGGNADLLHFPYRIAVIDRTTEFGPTFVSEGPLKPYQRREYDSPEARAEWEGSVMSSCGGGPLSAAPLSWREEFDRDCREPKRN